MYCTQNASGNDQVIFRKEISFIREHLLAVRTDIGREFDSRSGSRQFEQQTAAFEEHLRQINEKVNKLNMQVPALHMQMVPFTLRRLRQQCLAKYDQLVEEGSIVEVPTPSSESRASDTKTETITTESASDSSLWQFLARVFSRKT